MLNRFHILFLLKSQFGTSQDYEILFSSWPANWSSVISHVDVLLAWAPAHHCQFLERSKFYTWRSISEIFHEKIMSIPRWLTGQPTSSNSAELHFWAINRVLSLIVEVHFIWLIGIFFMEADLKVKVGHGWLLYLTVINLIMAMSKEHERCSGVRLSGCKMLGLTFRCENLTKVTYLGFPYLFYSRNESVTEVQRGPCGEHQTCHFLKNLK